MKRNIWEGFKSSKRDFEPEVSMALICDWIKKTIHATQNGYGLNGENLTNSLNRISIKYKKLYLEKGEKALWENIPAEASFEIIGESLSQVVQFAKGSSGGSKKIFVLKEKQKSLTIGVIYLDEVNQLFVYYHPSYGQLVQSNFNVFEEGIRKATKALDGLSDHLSSNKWSAKEMLPR